MQKIFYLALFALTVASHALAACDVSRMAQSGSGTSTDPWVGWETGTGLLPCGRGLNGVPPYSYIYAPAGFYTQASTITLQPGWKLVGDGKGLTPPNPAFTTGATVFKSAFDGTAFQTNFPLNSSTPAHIYVADLAIINTNSANKGSGFLEVGGTYVDIERVKVSGFKFGITLNQTEIAQVASCDIQAQSQIGLWLVNGGDYNPNNQIALPDLSGASSGFTNRISVHGCNFNEAAGVHGIADDGGLAHDFYDNNFNGCLHQIRLVGTSGARVATSEFENSAGASIWFTDVSFYAGPNGIGPNIGTTIEGNTIISVSGQSALDFTKNLTANHGPVVLTGNKIDTSAVALSNAVLVSRLALIGNQKLGSGVMVDNSTGVVLNV